MKDNDRIVKIKEDFLENIMSDIVATDTFQRLYDVAYYKAMCLGLFNELNEEKLFEREE